MKKATTALFFYLFLFFVALPCEAYKNFRKTIKGVLAIFFRPYLLFIRIPYDIFRTVRRCFTKEACAQCRVYGCLNDPDRLNNHDSVAWKLETQRILVLPAEIFIVIVDPFVQLILSPLLISNYTLQRIWEDECPGCPKFKRELDAHMI